MESSSPGEILRGMSKENVEIVRAMFEPFNGVDIADIDWSGKAMREIIEGSLARGQVDDDGVAIGIRPGRSYSDWDGLVQYLAEWFGPFSEYHLDSLDFIDAGDRVIVRHGRGESGAEAASGWTWN